MRVRIGAKISKSINAEYGEKNVRIPSPRQPKIAIETSGGKEMLTNPIAIAISNAPKLSM